MAGAALKCVDCPGPRVPGRLRCDPCLDQQKLRRARVRKLIPLEVTTEKRAGRLLDEAGFDHEKWGQRGKPDRLVHILNYAYCWLEFKREMLGTLTPAQKRRIPKMRARGELVFVVKNEEHAVRVCRTLRDEMRTHLQIRWSTIQMLYTNEGAW